MTVSELIEFLSKWENEGYGSLVVVVNDEIGINKAVVRIDNGGDGWISIDAST